MNNALVKIDASRKFTLPRACEVTVIPDGHQVILPEGEKVKVLQALGSAATITTGDGEMARLSSADSIAFGLIEAPAEPTTVDGDPDSFDVQQVWDAATTVYDPEIPVDIVELGLIYRVQADELPNGAWKVNIDMSVTAPFCGMGDILRQDLHNAVAAIARVEAVEVNLVFDPPWDVSRMSDVARLELGMM